MANFLVTGGCGFIGSHLVDNLVAEGHTVRILDDLSTGRRENISSTCEIVVGNVVNHKQVKDCMRGMDGVFHLAATSSVQESNDHWLSTHQINMTGAINVFDAARINHTPVVYASSAAVYGDNADIPLKEISISSPLTAYGSDKLGTELHARVASLVHGVPTAGMRLFNVYGPRQDPLSSYSGVISVFADRILHKKNITIFGDGEQTRDFVYVKDAVQFLRAGMNKIDCNAAVFNVCTNKSISLNQLAKMLMTITGHQVALLYEPHRIGDIRVSIGDSSFSKKMLGLSAEQTLMKGMQSLIKYLIDKKADDEQSVIAC